MRAKSRFLVMLPMLALAFAAALLAYEHLTGGVQSHNLLNRRDLPAFSNWLGLVTMPLLGLALGLRLARSPHGTGWAGIPTSILFALFGALLYGGALAVSFELDAPGITYVIFFGLFLCAVLFPIYRVEYIAGFVVGMAATFGTVLPFVIASIFGAISFVVRFLIRSVLAAFRRGRASNGAA